MKHDIVWLEHHTFICAPQIGRVIVTIQFVDQSKEVPLDLDAECFDVDIAISDPTERTEQFLEFLAGLITCLLLAIVRCPPGPRLRPYMASVAVENMQHRVPSLFSFPTGRQIGGRIAAAPPV